MTAAPEDLPARVAAGEAEGWVRVVRVPMVARDQFRAEAVEGAAPKER
jgi:hypothetical protein